MKIITMVPIAKGIPRDELSYFSAKPISVGTLVTAPFGNRSIKGVVVNQDDVRDLKSSIKQQSFRLRNLTLVHTDSVLAPAIFHSTQMTSNFFCAPAGAILETMLPGPLFNYYINHPSIPTERHIVHANIQAIQAPHHERISIYKTLVRENLGKHSSTLIIVPSVIHADILKEHLETGIEDRLIILHSKKSKKYLSEKIQLILEGGQPVVVICTAPFASLVRSDWDTCIIEECSSPYYRYTFGPDFDTRFYIEQFAKYLGMRLIYGDTILDVSIHAKISSRKILESRTTWHIKKPEDFTIIDMRAQEAVVPGIIPKKVIAIHPKTIERVIKTCRPESRLLFITTRKGLAPTTVCSDCGTLVTCPQCSAPLVLHKKKGTTDARIYMCHHCLLTTTPIDHCVQCGSWKLTPLGISTETVAAELKQQFPESTIFVADNESLTPTKIQSLIKSWNRSPKGILIGTPGILPYIETASFGCLVSMDSILSLPMYTGSERGLSTTLHFLEKITETAIIQTRSFQHETIQAIYNENIFDFVRDEIASRKMFGYPPEKILIKASFSMHKSEAADATSVFEKMFTAWQPDILVKRDTRADYVQVVIIIRCAPEDWNTPLSSLHRSIKDIARDAKIEINPEGVL